MRLYARRGGTEITVKELAQEAMLARNTVYNQIGSIDTLFSDVVSALISEMNLRVVRSASETAGAAARMALGIRFYIRRAQEEPDWGRFMHTFGPRAISMDDLASDHMGNDLRKGLADGEYRFRPDQFLGAISLVSSVVTGSMALVLGGHETWRVVGANAAEFVLKALGVSAAKARKYASSELPPLKTLDECLADR